jgi:hypothetical protein
MLGPSVIFASTPVAVAESIGAVRKPGQRILGAVSLLVAGLALLLVVGVLCSFFLALFTRS